MLDPTESAGQAAIRARFASEWDALLGGALIDQPASERRFYQPRVNERFPWWPLRDESQDRGAAS